MPPPLSTWLQIQILWLSSFLLLDTEDASEPEMFGMDDEDGDRIGLVISVMWWTLCRLSLLKSLQIISRENCWPKGTVTEDKRWWLIIHICKQLMKHLLIGTDPEYQKRVKELKELRDKRLFMTETFREYEVSILENTSCMLY